MLALRQPERDFGTGGDGEAHLCRMRPEWGRRAAGALQGSGGQRVPHVAGGDLAPPPPSHPLLPRSTPPRGPLITPLKTPTRRPLTVLPTPYPPPAHPLPTPCPPPAHPLPIPCPPTTHPLPTLYPPLAHPPCPPPLPTHPLPTPLAPLAHPLVPPLGTPPTWQVDGELYPGEKDLEELEEILGMCVGGGERRVRSALGMLQY